MDRYHGSTGSSAPASIRGKGTPETSLQKAIDWVVETMKAAAEYSGQRGIVLGMEDSKGVSQSADVCLEIMHRVDSPYHIRSQFDDHSPIDLDRIWKLFPQAEFRGFMSAEYESKSPDDPTAVAEVAKLVA